MTVRYGLRVGFALSMCLVLGLGAGCRRTPKKGPGSGYGGDETLQPLGLAGEGTAGSLSGRFEDGERITDVKLESVLFDYDSYQLRSSEYSKIEQVAQYMRSNATVKLVTEGHCDERGTREYNMSLGEHRALAVRAHLTGLGIDGARVQTRSFGEDQPLEAGHDEAAWRANRRVEFALYR